MNKKEFAMFCAALKTYFPKENLLPNSQAMELWFRQLEDIDYKLAEVALNKWVATNKWSPSIAEIREQAASVVQGETPDWSEGWEQTLKAVRKYGSYNQAAALKSLPPITRTAVERFGYMDLCRSTNSMPDRAHFQSIFKQVAERQQKENQLSGSLKTLIAGYQRKELGNGCERISSAGTEN